ncbi:hypothetical protein LJ739_12275 [Aestuariibacter halophilus]|uniref:Catalase n=1 Tax=Fluctibacter halophilus TaxID=226011 RepID=A0ABS8G900_9ALTE|nr:putative metalloprotease CJM1_0395 family protein [Aestuariibacter halophilus]MCC2617020.1 hypothetical protein [Aestuariibacter halophilus]
MNIVTPLPTAVVFTPANVNTEAARRDNVLRETIPQTSGLENSAAETGLGSESDRVKKPGQPPQPVTYERPQPQSANPTARDGDPLAKDNGEDPSAGRENAESRQEQQQAQREQREIDDLKQRDQEVRAHEQAHAARGGEHAGAPKYEFETGPDGKRYAVGGEVSIDISEEGSPEETLRKMQQVRSAALAPAEPSPQDLRVASEANQRAIEARKEIASEQAEQASQAYQRVFPDDQADAQNRQGPELDDIVKGIQGGGAPIRSLSEDPVAEAVGLETPRQQTRDLLSSRDERINRRAGVIENFYLNISETRQSQLQQTA